MDVGKLEKFTNGTELETVNLGGVATPTIRGMVVSMNSQADGQRGRIQARADAQNNRIQGRAEEQYAATQNRGEWAAINEYDQANPGVIQDEPAPPAPTLEERIAALQADYAAKLHAKLDEISVASALEDNDALTAKRAEYAALVEEQKAATDELILGGAA